MRKKTPTTGAIKCRLIADVSFVRRRLSGGVWEEMGGVSEPLVVPLIVSSQLVEADEIVPSLLNHSTPNEPTARSQAF